MSDGQIHLAIPLTTERSSIPWEGNAHFVTANHVQVAVILIDILAELCAKANLPIPYYRNEVETTPVNVDSNVVSCPYCEGKFSVLNAKAWDGSRHLLCNQKLSLNR
ncbi:MAG: hypothetical protein R3C59_22140 [Planctomycetaceae bacterium]